MDLFGQLNDLRARVSKLERLPQQQFRQAAGAITVVNPDNDAVMGIMGMGFDGSLGMTSYGGPTPPVPAGVSAAIVSNGILVAWDATFAPDAAGNPQYAPGDFARVNLQISLTADFGTPIWRETFETPRGGQRWLGVVAGQWFVRAITTSTAGKDSAPSTPIGPYTIT